MTLKEQYYYLIQNLIPNKAEIQYSFIKKHLDFTGKRVLEIGCGAGALACYIADNTDVESVTAIEPDLSMFSISKPSGPNYNIIECDGRKLTFEDNSFDYVYSIGVFEHIADLDKVFQEIERVLKPGGEVYAFFEPIFTCINGHHYQNLISEDNTLIPPYGHLFMSENEMYDYVCKKRDKLIAKDVVEWIYTSTYINRLRRKDYFNIFQNSGMKISHLSELIRINRNNGPIDNEFFNLEKKYQEYLLDSYSIEDLLVCGFEIMFQKAPYFKQMVDHSNKLLNK